MKKILIFLTLIFTFFFVGNSSVYAKTDQFYEGEYVDNIYMVRDDGVTKNYQQARFFRRVGDNRAAYCMQPFALFGTNYLYNGMTSGASFYSDEIWKRVTDIAGFGYGYQNHTDPKWYAITQLMIWEAMEPNHTFYFTDTLNGNRIDGLRAERDEIERLISESKILPSFAGKSYHSVLGKKIVLEDINHVLKNYRSDAPNIKIEGDTLIIEGKKDNCTDAILYTTYRNEDESIFFYFGQDHQQLMTSGKPNYNTAQIQYCFHQLKLNLQKVDKDTHSTTSLGEASLKGTVFTLYDKDHKKVTDITFDEEMKATIEGNEKEPLLDFGTYYLQEKTAGVGYQKDNKTYPITFDENNTTIYLELENEVIKGNLVIKKRFGNDKIMQSESGVSFEIYNKDHQWVDTITTDEHGLATIQLPYGHYTIIQLTTTLGYSKIDPFDLFIEEQKDYEFYIYDKEEIVTVEVPNTSSNQDMIVLIGGYFLVQKNSYSYWDD